MPKIFIFNDVWIFIIYDTDKNENRMHVHVGKKATKHLCKIWLEPDVEIDKAGDLTVKQQNEVLEVVKKYKKQMIQQWKDFMNGKTIDVIKAKKNEK
jgi:prophage DNA circulation protein